MKLNKRNCDIRFRLTPLDGDFLRVHWKIGGDNHYFFPSCLMGRQFSAFISALYCLYTEEHNNHMYFYRGDKNYSVTHTDTNPDSSFILTTKFSWDEEGRVSDIILTRRCMDRNVPQDNEPDSIEVEIICYKGHYRYTVGGRDLCYAVAKGCTEALKKYGFYGYDHSTGRQRFGDNIDISELLFIKSYALNVMDVRTLKEAWCDPNGYDRAYASAFDLEIELLLFDM